MSDLRWMAKLSDEERAVLLWKCIWCDSEKRYGPCSAPDGDGHQFEPVKSAERK